MYLRCKHLSWSFGSGLSTLPLFDQVHLESKPLTSPAHFLLTSAPTLPQKSPSCPTDATKSLPWHLGYLSWLQHPPSTENLSPLWLDSHLISVCWSVLLSRCWSAFPRALRQTNAHRIYSLYLHHLLQSLCSSSGQGSNTYSLWLTSSLLPTLTNNTVPEHRHLHVLLRCPWLLPFTSRNCVAESP